MATHGLAAAILVFAVVGFLDSLYFVLVAYRLMRPDPRWLPPVCRMDEASCARIVDTREGRLFGVPNGLLGLAYYGLVAAAATVAVATGRWIACAFLVAFASLSMSTSVYLAWALIARLRVVCAFCFLAHALNLALLILIVVACAV